MEFNHDTGATIMVKRVKGRIGRCLNCNNILYIKKFWGKETCIHCGHRNPIKAAIDHRFYFSGTVVTNQPTSEPTSVQCVCGNSVTKFPSQGNIICPYCGMKLYAKDLPTIEIEGTSHKEVMEVANNCLQKLIDAPISSQSDLGTTDIFSEKVLCSNLQKALLNIQKNPLYRGCNENEFNDAIRDNLCMIYDIYDQTRQGESGTGKQAGEIDLLIKDKRGLPYALIEALRLSSLDKATLNHHITKVLSKYDPIGCPYVFIFTYATGSNFDSFWSKYYQHLREYEFPYKTVSPVCECDNIYTESRHAYAILERSGIAFKVHFYAIHVPN